MTAQYNEIFNNTRERQQAEKYCILLTVFSKLVLALLFASLFLVVSHLV
jgi:hypothetical protein